MSEQHIDPPEPRPTIQVAVTLKQIGAENWNRGEMYMTYADTTAYLKVDGNEIGFVSGVIGGGLWIKLPNGDHYRLTPEEIWNTLCDALGLDDAPRVGRDK